MEDQDAMYWPSRRRPVVLRGPWSSPIDELKRLKRSYYTASTIWKQSYTYTLFSALNCQPQQRMQTISKDIVASHDRLGGGVIRGINCRLEWNKSQQDFRSPEYVLTHKWTWHKLHLNVDLRPRKFGFSALKLFRAVSCACGVLLHPQSAQYSVLEVWFGICGMLDSLRLLPSSSLKYCILLLLRDNARALNRAMLTSGIESWTAPSDFFMIKLSLYSFCNLSAWASKSG
jgi:hypothetical protein